MYIENVQRFADAVCSRETPCWRAKSWDITDVKSWKLSNFLRGYTENGIIDNRTSVDFVLEDFSKK
jgi:hypothetical protein